MRTKTRSEGIDLSEEDEQSGAVDHDMINLVNIIGGMENTKANAPILDDVTEEDDELSLHENQILRDKNNKELYIRKVLKSTEKRTAHQKRGNRIYNSVHACLFCSKKVAHIRAHLKSKHRQEPEVEALLNCKDANIKDTGYIALRCKGDDKHNCKSIAEGKGELLLSRRPTISFTSEDYGPCPKCREWMLKETISRHQPKCKSGDNTKTSKKNLVLQSQIISGRFNSSASSLLQKEVFSIMASDTITRVAQSDPLIVMLGESWLRRNISNKSKRKYYTSGRMRLSARLLEHLRKLKGGPKSMTMPLWKFLTPENFDLVVQAAHQVSLPDIEDEEELKSPSNAIKLKYDLTRLVNAKWGYALKNLEKETADNNIEDCRNFLHLMKVEWSERVTKLARAVLDERRLLANANELIPDPEDIAKLSTHLKQELSNVTQSQEYRHLAIYTQARLLVYNKRRSGEIDAVT